MRRKKIQNRRYRDSNTLFSECAILQSLTCCLAEKQAQSLSQVYKAGYSELLVGP